MNNKKSILLIDASDINFVSINRSLGEDYTLLRAENCAIARELLAQHSVDLIVLDMDIDNRQGKNFLTEIAPKTTAPIIVCSILEAADINKQGEALKAGAADFISQPPRLNILNLLIEKHISTQQLLAEKNISYDYFNQLRSAEDFAEPPCVLLIDDCESTSHQICEILEGFDVLWYTDIEEAEKALFEGQITNVELILLDRCFDNQYAGDTLLQKIRSNPTFKDLPVIMLSVTYQAQVIGKCIQLGANDFITKNLDATNIIERIRYQLLLHRHIYQATEIPVMTASEE